MVPSFCGVGETSAKSDHGIYQIRLPLHAGKNEVLSGVCLERITHTFPEYPLDGIVRTDIENACKLVGGDVSKLPSVPKVVGGDVDIMIGGKYQRYHPEKIFSLPSGLTIYRSPFLNINGSRGVIGGPHALFNKISKFQGTCNQLSFLTNQYQLYRIGYQVSPNNNFLTKNDF